MIRFVLSPDQSPLPDLQGKLPGRGAYLCPRRECVRRAFEKNLFARAFRSPVRHADAESMLVTLEQLVNDRVRSLIGLANRAGMVTSGSDAVEGALRTHQDVAFLLVTADTSPDRCAKFASLARIRSIPVVVGYDSGEIGRVLGKESRHVVLFRRNGLTDRLLLELKKYWEFNGIKGVEQT